MARTIEIYTMTSAGPTNQRVLVVNDTRVAGPRGGGSIRDVFDNIPRKELLYAIGAVTKTRHRKVKEERDVLLAELAELRADHGGCAKISRDYSNFSDTCPDRLLVLFRGNSGKVISICGHVLPELMTTYEPDTHKWSAPGDGLYVVDVCIENQRWTTEDGDEYDVVWTPTGFTPITDEMWSDYLDDLLPWPDDYYALKSTNSKPSAPCA